LPYQHKLPCRSYLRTDKHPGMRADFLGWFVISDSQ